MGAYVSYGICPLYLAIDYANLALETIVYGYGIKGIFSTNLTVRLEKGICRVSLSMFIRSLPLMD